jgi:hypothetical protein
MITSKKKAPISGQSTIFVNMSRKILLSCFLLIWVAVQFGCKKYPEDEKPPEKTDPPVDSTQLVQFTGLLGSDSVKIYENVGGYFNTQANQRITVAPPDSNTVTFVSLLKSNTSNTGIFTVSKSSLRFMGVNPDEAAFESFFAPGTIPFSTLLTPNGIQLSWVDNSGAVWNTNGDQTGSSFTIVSSTKRLVSGTALMDVKCLFTCKLYPVSGSPLTLSGRFNGSFKNN